MVNPDDAFATRPREEDQDLPALLRGLEGWLPSEAVWECAPVGPQPASLTTVAERAQVTRAVPKREAEFLTGRVLARRALERLGRPCSELPVGADRAPQWPAGVVGSIAHSDRWCLVAVAPSERLAGLGVDLEPEVPLQPELWPRVCTAAERTWIASMPAPERGVWALRHFISKEAVYKCQRPATGQFLGFQELELDFTAAVGRYSARRGPAHGAGDPSGTTALERILQNGTGVWRTVLNTGFSCFYLPGIR